MTKLCIDTVVRRASEAELPVSYLTWQAVRMAVMAVAATAGITNPLSAQEITAEKVAVNEVAGVGQRAAMRVSLLRAGADAAEVERVLGRPTTTTRLDAVGADLVLVYASEPVWTEVTLTSGHVTAIALDLLPVDSASLPARARTVKPMMRRNGVLALLGRPDEDERGAKFGLETERMLFIEPNESAFSVLFVDGLVVNVTSEDAKVSEIRALTLPTAVPDSFVGTDLSVGLSPKQADALLGPPVYLPTASALEGEPALYETRFTGSGCRVVSLTFIGEALTAFTIWPPDVVDNLGITCSSVAERHQ